MCYHSASSGFCSVRCGLGIFDARHFCLTLNIAQMEKHFITPEEFLHNCSSPLLAHCVVVPCCKCYWCLSRICREVRVLRKLPNEPRDELRDENLVTRSSPFFPA